MFARILVPLDGSEMAETALPFAEAFRKEFDSAVTLIHLLENRAPGKIHGERHLRDEREAEAYLDEIIEKRFPPGAKVTRHVHAQGTGNVSLGLSEHSRELAQDLVVMCVHGKGGFERFLEGTIAERIMSRQVIPVLLVRSGIRSEPVGSFRRILVPLDGKNGHEHSLPVATELAMKSGAGMTLVTVVPTWFTRKGTGRAAGFFLPAASSAYLEYSAAAADTYLRERADAAVKAGIDTDVLVRRGKPAKQVSRAAVEIGADLIILGTHGRAGTRAFWAESEAARIVAGTDLPVLLVPSLASARA